MLLPKNVVVQASQSVKELQSNLMAAKTGSQRLGEALLRFNQVARVYGQWHSHWADGELEFDDLRVSDMAFLGESADDTVTYLDVAEAVLKFLDLHIVQYGMDFFRF